MITKVGCWIDYLVSIAYAHLRGWSYGDCRSSSAFEVIYRFEGLICKFGGIIYMIEGIIYRSVVTESCISFMYSNISHHHTDDSGSFSISSKPQQQYHPKHFSTSTLMTFLKKKAFLQWLLTTY